MAIRETIHQPKSSKQFTKQNKKKTATLTHYYSIINIITKYNFFFLGFQLKSILYFYFPLFEEIRSLV